MRFNIITNFETLGGLRCDYELVCRELQALGHTTHGIQFNHPADAIPPADVNLFLETVVPRAFASAPAQWLIPNPEWWLPHYHTCLPHITKILCKTQDGVRLFTQIAGEPRVSYLGFLSRDLYQPDIPRTKKFLHIAGKSIAKNTAELLTAWESLSYPLTIVTALQSVIHKAAYNAHISCRSQITVEELSRLANEHLFHICPSQYEGFGHYLHEAMGVGGLVLTINAPPMSEFGTPVELLMPATWCGKLQLAEMHRVTPPQIIEHVERAMALTELRIRELSLEARHLFCAGLFEFRHRLKATVEEHERHCGGR